MPLIASPHGIPIGARMDGRLHPARRLKTKTLLRIFFSKWKSESNCRFRPILNGSRGMQIILAMSRPTGWQLVEQKWGQHDSIGWIIVGNVLKTTSNNWSCNGLWPNSVLGLQRSLLHRELRGHRCRLAIQKLD